MCVGGGGAGESVGSGGDREVVIDDAQEAGLNTRALLDGSVGGGVSMGG